MAPSSTRSARSTSMVKSTWPGVSMMLMLLLAPLAVRGGRLDRDALLALEIHRVHLGADAVLAADLVDRVDAARVIEDALGQRGLARVDMRRDADVPNFFDLRVRHCAGSFAFGGRNILTFSMNASLLRLRAAWSDSEGEVAVRVNDSGRIAAVPAACDDGGRASARPCLDRPRRGSRRRVRGRRDDDAGRRRSLRAATLGDGDHCGSERGGGEPSTLHHYCAGGKTAASDACVMGCHLAPPGTPTIATTAASIIIHGAAATRTNHASQPRRQLRRWHRRSHRGPGARVGLRAAAPPRRARRARRHVHARGEQLSNRRLPIDCNRFCRKRETAFGNVETSDNGCQSATSVIHVSI